LQAEDIKSKAVEIEFKDRLIAEQKRKTEELALKDIGLGQVKVDAARAIERLKSRVQNKEKMKQEMEKIINQMYCGITVKEFSKIFREPDSTQVWTDSQNGEVKGVRFFWDQFVIETEYHTLAQYLEDKRRYNNSHEVVIEAAKHCVIDEIKMDYGMTKDRWRICN
jgi:hypothetical protein